MKKSAFTLIELLVVISIIAILAGIALPVYNTVMEKARATQDLANLRQIGIGSTAYLADNNDQTFSSTAATSWPVTLYSKYVPNWKTFKSPFDNRQDAPPVSAGTGVPCSYGINPNILNQTTSPGFDGNTTKYTSPSQLIFMAPNIDVAQTTVAFISTGTGDQNIALVIPTGQVTTVAAFRGTHSHRAFINALYADSHVAQLSYTDFSTSTGNDLAGFRWNPLYVAP